MLKQDFYDTRVIAILRGAAGKDLEEMAEAICEGGIRFSEVTLNSPDALLSIERLRERFGGRMHIGAGTVTNLKAVREAVAAGAEFIVTPNIDADVIRYCVSNDILITPGALTPTEIEEAMRLGSEFVKVFPVGRLGAGYIKDVMAPYDKAKLIAVGGINAENSEEYRKSGAFGIGVGGSLCKVPEDRDFGKISDYARRLVESFSR